MQFEITRFDKAIMFTQALNLPVPLRYLRIRRKQKLFQQNRIVGKGFWHGNHAVDYTDSGYKARRQNLMRTVAPEVKTIQQPVQFLNCQHYRLVVIVGRGFESLGLQAF